MAIYVVGDIQGCLKPLKAVLKKVHFDPRCDVLWSVGDMVNRGPQSLETLRFLKSLGDACICVLGNHDLFLLGLAAGGDTSRRGSLGEVLAAPDSAELIDWLRYRPLLHHDAKTHWAMVHAGLHPDWSLKKAKKRAAAVEEKLRGKKWKKFCLKLYHADFPTSEPPKGDKRSLLFNAAVLTRSRYCTRDGHFRWRRGYGPSRSGREKAWFSFSRLAWRRDCRVVFGHWAAKGLVLNQPHVLGLDSGCVWGGSLALAKLGKKGRFCIVANLRCKACRKPDRIKE